MSIEEVIKKRGITEVLHFTTNLGLLGTLHSKALKSRKRLGTDAQLAYIFSPNAAFRKDTAWLDYINLSISRINTQFFDVSSGRWHRDRDIWWCILAFDPVILTHKGVYFSTTNNIYTGVQRGTGSTGLDSIFAKVVKRWEGNTVVRPNSLDDAIPTCEQAEVLYPGELSTDYLRKVYVVSGDDQDEAYGQVSAVVHKRIPVIIDQDKFKRL